MSDSADNLGVKVRDFSLWYGDFQALFNVELDIKDGIITGLIGPSGCGKTTLLRSLNRVNERYGNVRFLCGTSTPVEVASCRRVS